MKILKGKVISTKMAKTATVEVERIVSHKLYNKRFKRTKTYQVHDEVGVKVGDLVRFAAGKPVSKTKKWHILKSKSDKIDVTPKKTAKSAKTK